MASCFGSMPCDQTPGGVTAMKRVERRRIIEKLLDEMEEEDVGISLFSSQYLDSADLEFFGEKDRQTVIFILKRLTEDSRRHRIMLEHIVEEVGRQSHGS